MNTAEHLSTSVKLVDLIVDLVDLPAELPFERGLQVTGIQIDSRELAKGDLFLACFGRNHDARDYIEDAVERGVTAVLAEAGCGWQGIKMIGDVPVIAVDKLRKRISEIAGRYYGHPSRSLNLIGITGTNGKTSCSLFLAQAYELLGLRSGVIGTLGYGSTDSLKETSLTTPDAVFTQRALAEMKGQGISVVPMEVSSVGIHQKRVAALQFEIALFTNLSRDHLDYHESMESYAETKARLFSSEGLKTAVINLDDPYSIQLLNSIPRSVDICAYSLTNTAAAVYVSDLKLSRQGFSAVVHTPYGKGQVSSNLVGHFNISNLLAVVGVLVATKNNNPDFDLDKLFSVINELKSVSGRMEIVGDTSEITAIVDYAHTPDGLRSALKAVSDHFEGKIWCVFGCGGNRDRGKRPLMGEVAESFADEIIISDDNPRNEEGDEIVQHILSGIEDNSAVSIVRDRAQAIDYAISHAAPGDVVLVAGKGHENYQDIGGNRHLFSDVNQVRLSLAKRLQAVRKY